MVWEVVRDIMELGERPATMRLSKRYPTGSEVGAAALGAHHKRGFL